MDLSTARRIGVSPERAMGALVDAYDKAARGPGSKKTNLIEAIIWTIEQGYWHSGDRLPTEVELTDALPVSLGTVQAAFRSLVDAGVVERKPGVGTHVTDLTERGGDRWFMRFVAAGDDDLLPLEVLDARVEETAETGPWAAFLQNCPSFIRITRLVSIDGRFNATAQAYLDGTAYRPLLDFDLGVVRQLHIRQILQDRFNAPTVSRKVRIRFVTIDGPLAQQLAVAPGTQGMALEVSSYTLRDTPLCFQRFTIPPNDLALDVKTG